MRAETTLPGVIMILSAGSSIAYTFAGDWRRALYWAAATVLTLSVTV